MSGYVYRYAGWPAVVALGLAVLLLPLVTGLLEGRTMAGTCLSRGRLAWGICGIGDLSEKQRAPFS